MNAKALAQGAGLATSGARLTLEGRLDFTSVKSLEARGRAWLEGEDAPQHCLLDLSGVHYSNSAGVALLLAWLRTARKAGKTLTPINMPDSLEAIIRLGGLAGILEDKP